MFEIHHIFSFINKLKKSSKIKLLLDNLRVQNSMLIKCNKPQNFYNTFPMFKCLKNENRRKMKKIQNNFFFKYLFFLLIKVELWNKVKNRRKRKRNKQKYWTIKETNFNGN